MRFVTLKAGLYWLLVLRVVLLLVEAVGEYVHLTEFIVYLTALVAYHFRRRWSLNLVMATSIVTIAVLVFYPHILLHGSPSERTILLFISLFNSFAFLFVSYKVYIDWKSD